MKAWMSSNFGQIPTPTPELSALASLKNCCIYVVTTLAPSFLIRSSSFLQVTMTTITSRTTLKFGQIGPRTAELAALEHLEKILIDLKWEKSCEHSSAFIFNWIFLILAGIKDIHESLDEFEFRLICNIVMTLD